MAENQAIETQDKTQVTISSDLTETKSILNELIKEWEAGNRTRERSLVITKLQEAKFWLVEAQRLES